MVVRQRVRSYRFEAPSWTSASTAPPLPPINTALIVEWDRPEPLVLEVHSHVDPVTVRGIALQATAGLARGTKVRATGAPISVPVGDAVLGPAARRGRDGARPRARPAGRYAATRHPQSAAGARGRDLDHRGVRDRHQGDRPSRAARPGRQGRHVRRRRRRQDRAGDGADPRHGREIPGHLRLCRGRRALPRRP